MWPSDRRVPVALYNFYSHIPCGMWRPCALYCAIPRWISTHTSRVGCDLNDYNRNFLLMHFYSHIPCGMWPFSGWFFIIPLNFYSHIPCGMWRPHGLTVNISGHFYSHIPCGMWQQSVVDGIFVYEFLLTHPVWDVTRFRVLLQCSQEISTHTSRVGCD